MPSEKVGEILATASPDQRQAIERIIYEQRVLASSHRGPLPPPEALAEYCRLIPDGGNRIMIRHEKQADHWMRLEESTIKTQLEQSSAGQWMGVTPGLFGLGVSGFCIYTGHDAAGATLGGTTLVGLVSVFVAGKTELIRSLLRKQPRPTHDDTEADAVESNRQILVDDKEPPVVSK